MWLRIDTSLGNFMIQWFTGAKCHPYFKSCRIFWMDVLRSKGKEEGCAGLSLLGICLFKLYV